MLLLLSVLSLTVGLVLLVIFSSILVSFSEKIARNFQISPLIIGATVVAIGTSLPEYAVSINAVIEGNSDMAVANIVGSNIANIALVLGIAFLGGRMRIGRTKTQINAAIVLIITAFLGVFLILGKPLGRMVGVSFLLGAAGVIIWEWYSGVRGAKEEDHKLFDHHYKKHSGLFLATIFIIIAIVGIALGGRLVVDSSLNISQILHISSSFLGLTIVAVGTSLPELVTSLIGILKKEEKLVVGNILGSNIFNIFLILGSVFTYKTVLFSNFISTIFMVLTALVLFFIVLHNKGKHVSHLWGYVLLFIYLCYLFLLSQ